MTNEIKPCPVCGDKPDYRFYGNDLWFFCKNKDCMLEEAAEFTPHAWNDLRSKEQQTESPALRDRFAMAALTAVMSNVYCNMHDDFDKVSAMCYEVADAMMKARGGEK